jgi:hypothetical protein
MGFSQKVKDKVMVESARRCSCCRRYKGVKVEVHHIIPQSMGGPDTFENAIALCFDCHSDAGHYNINHPKGTKFSPNELRLAKDTLYADVTAGRIELPEFHYDDLHISFLIGKNMQDVEQILKGDLSPIPLDNCVFFGKGMAENLLTF